MRLTSSFAVFRARPAERALSKARWYGRDGRIEAAEKAYRAALSSRPDLAAGWIELCDLLRRAGRSEDALDAARAAAAHFGPSAAMPLALEGAALAELGRTPEAVRALEAALERDGNLALAWHELALAAFRVGELSRALLALDRAFTLEPHTDSLMLRGRILRAAGQYEAALVAFEAAHQSGEHDEQRTDAVREAAATRRAACLGGKRPRSFTARERVFADTGAVLIGHDETGTPLELLLSSALAALPLLARRLGWHPSAVAGVLDEDHALAAAAGRALGADVVATDSLEGRHIPLVVTTCHVGDPAWTRQRERLEHWRTGATFALVQTPEAASDAADVVGTVMPCDERCAAAVLAALNAPAQPPSDIEEAARLGSCPEAPWRRRLLRAVA